MLKPIAVLIVLSLLLIAPTTILAAPEGGPQGGSEKSGGPDCLPGEAFENDDVRIWFQGLKGHLKVFDKRDNNTSLVYDYQTITIDEVEGNATLANINLERAYPHDSTCLVEDNEEWVNVTYVVDFEVSGTTGQPVGDAEVTFVWHFNKSSQGAKFDLFVADWPWQGNASELAFQFAVTSAYTIEPAENGIGFRDGSDSRGYIEWAPNATAHYDDGHNETAIVESETDASEHHADVRLTFTNVTAGYSFLDYDPWVGVGDYIIIAGILIGLAPLQAILPEPVVDLVSRLV